MKCKKAAARFLLILCVILCVIMAAAADSPEKWTIRFFNRHRETLDSEISNDMETGQAASELHLTFNFWDGEHPVVEYIVVRRGTASASRYYGVFYSFDGEPVSFQNAGELLIPAAEETWTWSGEGDNYGLVRRLDGNWFYFEAAL